MLTFKELTVADKPWITSILRKTNRRGCEYSFSCAMMWAGVYRLTAAQVENCFVMRSLYRDTPAYLFPAGPDCAKAVGALGRLSAEQGCPLRFYSLTREDREVLERFFPGCFLFEEQPDGREYLYDAESLKTLAGKKLHAKRTHINRFTELNPGWSFEEITPENIAECRAMHEIWLRQIGDEASRSLVKESQAVDTAFELFFQMGLCGGCLRTPDGIVAYAMGERLGGGAGDTFDVRIEKAFYDIPGAYTMINREFARVACAQSGIAFINREDDAGDEGLRRAKLSYRPALFLDKYTACENAPGLCARQPGLASEE